MRKVMALVAAALMALVVGATSSTAATATLFATHPSVAAQPSSGQQIKDMAVKNGRLYLGHGNYTANTGPIDIAYVELASGATGVALQDAPTEELNVFRKFRGSLFSPWIDPTGWGGAVNGGYTTDEGGWRHVFTTPAGHLYDYTELGSSRFLAGAIAYGGAGIWQNDGSGWRLVRSEVSPGGATTWERFYWIVTMGGKVYAQAVHKGMQSGGELPTSQPFTMLVYDGSRWSTSRAVVQGVWDASDIEVFQGKAYYNHLVFNGKRVVRSGAPYGVVDWYNTGTYLYAITGAGQVLRTDGRTWTTVTTVSGFTGSVRSLAVDGGYVYVGNNAAQVWRVRL